LKIITLKTSVAAVALTLASSHVVLAQDADNSSLEKVVITGSNLKRIDAETATPVQILRREDITRLGVNSVRDIIDTLTSSTGSLSDIGGSNSFASGASSASLRNLGKQSTLILLNSRRVAPYALADYNEVFTNLDSLPLDAIDRVEILRNGGSAVYGSDAVAGVINIITRSDYQGVQVRANYEQSVANEQFNTKTASLTGGFGDFAKDGYNVLANVEVFKRGNVIWRDVLDDINPAYGDKFTALAPKSGGPFGNRGAGSTFSYPGNFIGQGPIATCATVNSAGQCIYDRFNRFEAVPQADRVNALVSGKLNLGGGTEGFSEVLYSHTKTSYTSAFGSYGSNNADTIWGDPSTGMGKTFGPRFLSPDSPLNTTGEPLEIRYRYADAPSGSVSSSDQYRVLAGLRGTFNKYDWESAVGAMGSKTKSRTYGSISDSGFKQVVGDYTKTLAGDPTCEANFPGYCQYTAADPNFFNHGYKLGQANSADVIKTLFPEQGYDGKITQYFADAKITGEIGKIGDRAIGLAVGGEVRHEKFQITPTANLQSGDIVGYGDATADASRTTEAVFAEMNLPITKQLELVGAARVDKFPGFKTHASPKLAARFEVTPALLLRATVESGFRAPNLTESAQSTKFAFDNGVVDPKRCSQAQSLGDDLRSQANALPATDPNQALKLARADQVVQNECSAGVASIVRNNPNLKPEVTHSATAGFVLEPVKGTSVSLDYWHIERKDEIGLKSTDDLLAAEADQAPGVVNRLPLSQDKSFTAAEQVAYGVTSGPLASTSGQFENVSRTKTSGVDLGASSRFNTRYGRLDLGANATYLLSLKNFSSTLGDYGDNLAGRYGYSKTVANVSAALTTGVFTNSLRLVYNSKTSLNTDYYDDSYTQDGCKAKKWSVDECKVKAFERLDYNISYSGIKDLTLSMFVRNLTGRRPPVDLRALNDVGGGVIPQDYADVQGRVVRVTAEYKFR
jgi:iron complex outermembrane receptor protein